MTKVRDITVLATQHAALEALAKAHPDITMAHAIGAIISLTTAAAIEADDTRTIEHSAARALANGKVQEQLPPWQ